MEFEYDTNKSRVNQKKHGISFEESKQLWQVSKVKIQGRTTHETRKMVIGKLKGKFYSCVFTERGEKIRLISTRRSRKKEEAIYNEQKQKENKSN
jgi:uncharacterized protein